MTESDIDPSIFYKTLSDIYEQALPFNKHIGMRVVECKEDTASIRIDMRDEFVGNPYRGGVLHGGVISSVLDVVGGLTASVGLLEQLHGKSLKEIEERFSRMGTIDLRVDFLRPGQGSFFLSKGTVLRTGNKVAVTRMNMRNDKDVLIAVGTGTYLVG